MKKTKSEHIYGIVNHQKPVIVPTKTKLSKKDELVCLRARNETLMDELRAYAYGNAYDKETGLPWAHRLIETQKLIAKFESDAIA